MAQWWETPAPSLNPPDPVTTQIPNALTPALPGAQDNPYLRSALSAYQQMRDQSRANLTPAKPAPVAPVEPEPPTEGLISKIGGTVLTPIAETLTQLGPALYNVADAATGGYLDEGRRRLQAGAQNLLGDDVRWQDIPTMAEGAAHNKALLMPYESAGLQAGRQQLSQAQGVGESLKTVATNPYLLTGMVAESLPWMIGIAGPAKAAATAAFEGALAKGATQAVAEAAAKTAATRASIAGNFAISGGTSGLSAQERIYGMSEAELANSPAYQQLRQQGFDHRAAQEALARSANVKTTAVAGTLGAGATALLGGGLESQIAQRLAGVAGPSQGVVKNILGGAARESGEEYLQSGGERLGENVGLQAVNPTTPLLNHVFEDAAVGALVGAVAGGTFGALGDTDRTRQGRAGQDATHRADLARLALAHLDEPRLAAAAEQARKALADNPKMPARQRQALESAIGHLDTDLQGRANGEGLRQVLADPTQLQTLRGQATLAGMADDARVSQLSDEELMTAAEQAVQMAQTPALGQGLRQQFTEVAQAYAGHLKARQQLANLDAALQADPTIAPSLAARITQAATGQPKKGITPEYSRASLDDTELTRHLTAAERLLSQHSARLDEEQRARLTEARAALQAEREQRAANPDWQARNAQIMQANDPREVRLRQAFAKNPEKTVARLTANDAPLIDTLIQSFESRAQNYAQTGYPIPESITRPLNLLQARKTALETDATQKQQAAEAKRQADYLRQQKSPVPTLADALDLTPTNADPLGDWLQQRADIADEQGQMLKRAIAALQGASGPQATPEQQRRAEEGRRLIAARLEGELLQQGIEEQAARAQAQAAVDDWIGSGARPRASGVIGQMGQPLGNPAPAQGRQELNRLLGPDTSPAPVPTATPGAPRSLIDLLQRPSTAHAVPTAPMAAEGPMATPAPPAPRARPKMTQAEIKVQQGQRSAALQQSEQRVEQVRQAIAVYRQGQIDRPTLLQQLASQVARGELHQDALMGIMKNVAPSSFDEIGAALRQAERQHQAASKTSAPAQSPTDFPPVTKLATLSEAELDALQTRFSAWLDQHGDENSWVQMPDGSRAQTIVRIREMKTVRDYQRALEDASIQAYRNRPAPPPPPSRPADPRQAEREAQLEKKRKDREAQVDALRQAIEARLAAIRQQARARKAAGEDPQTIIKAWSPLLREGKAHLDWLEQRAFEATDGKGRSVNPRAAGAQWTAIPESLRAFAEEKTPAPKSAPQPQPETAREKGQAQTPPVLNAAAKGAGVKKEPSKKAQPEKKTAVPPAAVPPAVPVHTTPEGQTEPVTLAVVQEALQESIPNRVSAQEKAKTIAAHIGDVLQKIDAAIKTAFADHGDLWKKLGKAKAKDALEHHQRQLVRESKAAQGQIANTLVKGLNDLQKEYGTRLHSAQQVARRQKGESPDAKLQATFHAVDALWQQAKAARTDAERWALYQSQATAIEEVLSETSSYISSYLAEPLRTAISRWKGTQKALQEIENQLPTAHDTIKTIVSIHVPGDGVFTVPNTVPALQKLRALIAKSTVFKKGALPDSRSKPQSFSTKPDPASDAILALVREKEGDHAENVANAWNLALARDVTVIVSPTGSGKTDFAGKDWQAYLRQNAPLLYVNAQPVDVARYPALAGNGAFVVAQRNTSDQGKGWDVIHADTGTLVAQGEKTPESALAALERLLKEKAITAEKMRSAIQKRITVLAEGLSVPATAADVKAGIEARMESWVEQVQNPKPETRPEPKAPEPETPQSLAEQATAIIDRALTSIESAGPGSALIPRIEEATMANIAHLQEKGLSADEVARFQESFRNEARKRTAPEPAPVAQPKAAPATPAQAHPKAASSPASKAPKANYADANALRQARKDGQIDTPTLIQGLAQQVVSGKIPIGKLFGNLQAFDDWSEGDVATALREAGMAPAKLKELGYEQKFAAASTPAAVTDAIQSLTGDRLVQDLIDAGTLRVVARQAQLPASIVIPSGQRIAGAVDPETGVVYLIAENIAPGEIEGFLAHEVGVHQAQLGLNQPKSRALRLAHALTRLVGARHILGEPTFNDVLTQLQRLRAVSKPVQAAYAAAEKAMGKLNQSPALLHEEALAYLVQNHPKTSLAQQIIAAVRAFLYKAGLKINLTENDLQALAVAALRGRAGTKPASSAREVALQRAAQAQQDLEAARQYADVVARYTNPDGSKKAGWLKAPNGQPTKLNERQWVQVRTENFKRWFGDWEANDHRRFLEGSPVAILRGDEFVADGVPLTVKVPQWYRDHGVDTVETPDIGTVRLDERAVKSSISHGVGRDKSAAFAAIPDILKQGRLLEQQKLTGSRDAGSAYYVAAPIRIGDRLMVAIAIIKSDSHGARLYVHEVVLTEKLQQAAFKTSADAAEAGARPGAAAGAIRTVLQKIFEINPSDVSQVIDANGEPRVVYHATRGDFNAFHEDKRSDGFGYYFGLTPKGAKKAASGKTRIIEAFIKAHHIAGSAKAPAANWVEMRFDGMGRRLVDEGYDAAFIRDEAQGALVVRNPTQIKSSMGNTGAFSPDNADIRFAYSLGQAEPNLTAEEVLQRIEAGGEVTAEEFALLQAYLSGASRAVPASGVDAPSFKNWFGNSKIKGRNGQPLKMYHGTSADFTVFEAATSGASTSHPTAALGFFFTNNRAHAAEKYGDRVMEVYLALEKPYVMTDADLRRMDTFEDARALRRKLEAQGYDGVVMPAETKTRYVVAFRPDQIKFTTNETYTRGENDLRFAIASSRTLTPEQQAAMDKIGRRDPQGWGARFAGLRERIGLKLRQAIADHHAALLDLDRQAYGEGVVENQTAAASWVKARLSRSVDGPMHLLLHESGLRLDADGALDVLPSVKGLQKVLAPLGSEVDDFLKWVAGNRAERLMQEGRENLFTAEDITALKTLNQGTMADGRNRATVYASVLKDFVALQKSVMDIAEQSGLIDGNERHVWEHDFYVPFYRLAEDTQDVRSINAGDGLVRQEAFKKLKGGKDRLNDLLENTVMNWQHLLSASLKNNAARQALTNAQRVRYDGIPVAEPLDPAKESTKGAVYYRQNGKQQWFRVNDPLVLEAITALDFNGLKGPVMSLLRKARHLLTRTTTISPAFKVANLLRDTVQTLAVSQVSAKTGGVGNVIQGWKNYAADSAIRQQMLAGGGAFLFGSTLEDHAEAMKKLLDKGVRPATILDTPAKLWDVLSLAYWKYEALGDRLENANRAALYEQLRKQGKSHLYASFQARDLLDFSQSGASGAVRFLTAVVPFLNARIQGLDKLGRAASQSAQRGRFAVTLAAVTLASAALYLLYKDDDDFKQREEWDRDTYWWFKIGDTVFRIPKPFEVGALATLLGDRIMEQIFDREATPALYLDRLKQTLTQTFSVSMPQLFAPAVDVWRNRGSFTQRPIETLAQQRLSPELRQTASTSDVARGVSAASQGFLSPVQADYLIAGYFGWVGRQAVLMADHATRPLTDRPSPERLPVISDLMQRFVPTEQGGHSKYLTRFYEVAKTTEQHYADINELVKRGEIDAAKALVQRHREDLTRLKLYRKASTQLNDWNNQLKLLADLPASQISAEQRQRARETLQAAKLRLAQAVMAGQPAR